MTLAPIRGFGSRNCIGFEDLEQQYQKLSTRLQQCTPTREEQPRDLLKEGDALLKKMALQATGDFDKRERLELYQLQLKTFKEHFHYEDEPKKATTFSFQNVRREVADENYNGNVPQEVGSTFGGRAVYGGKLAKISDQLRVNPLKQFAETAVPNLSLSSSADKYANATIDGESEKKASKRPDKEKTPILKVERELVIETVEDLNDWDAFI